MSNTGTPAYRPTADCIWNSFRSSGKRHIILTGSRGIGKTTLLSGLFGSAMVGIATWAEKGKAVFLRDNQTGTCVQIGVYDDSLPGNENKMVLCRQGLEQAGIPAIRNCMCMDREWICIDEIGYLECGCDEYQRVIEDAMEKKRVAAVVRKQNLPFLQRLCCRDDVFLMDLDAPFGNIGCVIMASGMGTRFGGNKLMADFLGQPLIQRILDATTGIFAQRVVVTRHEEIALLCRERGIQVILHDQPQRSDTIRLGLERMDGVQRCMFCQGDQPLLRKETIAALALASAQAPMEIWRPICENIPGAPVVFPEWAFSELKNLPDGKGGSTIIKKYPEHLRTMAIQNRDELQDVDSPENLQDLLSRHRECTNLHQ